jgi:prophage regulatory protein
MDDSRASSQLVSRALSPRPFTGSSSAGSTCLPSSGLLCNRSWSAPSNNARLLIQHRSLLGGCKFWLVIGTFTDHRPSDSYRLISHRHCSNIRVAGQNHISINMEGNSMYSLIRLNEVKRITGLSGATIYRFIASRKFPVQVKLGERSVAWLASEVQAWIESKAAARNS